MELALERKRDQKMESLKNQIEGIEKEAIIRSLRESDWIMAKAA
jgi:transcriptional regulator with GAF, ATPase, and Fis domain